MMTGIEDRLTNLERSIRRWKLATISLILLIGVAFIVGAEKVPVPAILQARRIELIDSQGHAAIVLESKPTENSLVVWGPDHEHAAVLVSQSNKASLMLLKNKEAPEVFAQAAEDGGQLGVTNGVGGITATGRESLNLVGGSHGTALLQNIDGRPQSHLSFNKEGAELELKARPGKSATRLVGSARGGRVEILAEDGKAIWSAPAAVAESK
jgi:hypothetical protein